MQLSTIAAMRFSRFSKAVIFVACTLLLALLLLPEAAAALRTVKLMQNLGRAATYMLDGTGLQEQEWKGHLDGAPLRALLYGPAGSPRGTGVLFIPGLSPFGIDNPRFISAAQALARSGYYVLAPDIESFKRMNLDPGAVDEIGYWVQRMREERTVPMGKIGVIGVSVAGTFSLLAASDTDTAAGPDFIVSIGGYQDLLHCLGNWFSDAPSMSRHGDYPVHNYGKWITMLEALDLHDDGAERRHLEKLLRGMLETGRKPEAPAGWSEQGKRWFRMAVSSNSADLDLYRKIEQHVSAKFRSLNPDGVLPQIQCRVFLVHGSNDELIPPEETLKLERRLTSARTSVLITPIISHTHPQLEHLGTVRRYREYVRAAWFLYSFVKES
jgi:pimeloyl-ACP methyl ester carboxylesterase